MKILVKLLLVGMIILVSTVAKSSSKYTYVFEERGYKVAVLDDADKVVLKGDLDANTFSSGAYSIRSRVIYHKQDSIGYIRGRKIFVNNKKYRFKKAWFQRNAILENMSTNKKSHSLVLANKGRMQWEIKLENNATLPVLEEDILSQWLLFKKIKQRVGYKYYIESPIIGGLTTGVLIFFLVK